MGFAIVVFSESINIVESGVVELEGLEESFYLALGGRFSNGAEDVFYAVFRAEACESAVTVVAPVLRTVI
jgi:hypothetical protein